MDYYFIGWCRFITCTVTFQLVLTFSNVPVGVTNPNQLVGLKPAAYGAITGTLLKVVLHGVLF